MISWKPWSSSVVAGTLFALFVLPVCADAQTGWSGSVATLSAAAERANDAELAVDAAGNAFAIWSWGSGATQVIQVARYSAASGVWSSPISLTSPAEGLDDPRVAVDANGNAIASWIRSLASTGGVVQTARYTAATNSWSAPSDLPGASDAIFPEVVIDHVGSATATWHYLQFPVYHLRAARYTASTGTWGGVVDIASTGNGASGGGRSMVVDAAGDVTVVWVVNQNHTNYLIRAARYTASTQTWGAPVTLDGGVGDARKPRNTIDSAGNVMAIWPRASGGATTGLYTSRYSKASNSWSPAAAIPTTSGDVEGERLVMDPGGDAMAIWEQSGGADNVLQAARYSAATGTWSAVTTVSDAAQDSDEAELAVDSAGNAIAIWAREDSTTTVILAARYTRSTNIWSTPVPLSPAGHVGDDPSVLFDAAGNATAIWEAFNGTQDVIQATRWLAGSTGVTTPTNLRATSIVGNTVTIAWDAPTAGATPTGYVLEGGVAPGQVLASVATGSAATTFTFTAPSGVFFIRIHALTGTARSAASNEILIAVNVPTLPSAPVNLTGQANGSSLSLAWQNTAAGGSPTATILEVTGSITTSVTLPATESFSYAGVPTGTYTFAVRASNASGVSAASNPVTLTFPGPCAAPGVPTNFVATKSGNIVSVSWAPPATGPTPTSYTLLVTGSFAGSFSTPGLTLAGAAPPGSYTLSVVARNACGAGPATPPQTVVIP